MSEVRALIEQLVAAGVDPIEAAEVVARAAIHGAATAPHRSAAAIRQERYRRNKASQTATSDACDDSDATLSPKEKSPTPPKETTPYPVTPSPPKGGSVPAGFEDFWATYPNKVGKAEAVKAFAKASRKAPLEAIMAGLRAYVAKTDDRPWCNPATWLNQERWTDEPAATSPPSRPPTKGEVIAGFRERLRNERRADGRNLGPDGGDGRLLSIAGRAG